MVISQTSQALNLCTSTLEFSGSTEQVEAERLLLLASINFFMHYSNFFRSFRTNFIPKKVIINIANV